MRKIVSVLLTANVPFMVLNFANAQYHQTICAVKSLSFALATFQIYRIALLPLETLHVRCVSMWLRNCVHTKINICSVHHFLRGNTAYGSGMNEG